MVRIGSVGEMLTRMWAVKQACVRTETDVLRDDLPLTVRLSPPSQTYTSEQLQDPLKTTGSSAQLMKPV